VFWENLFSQYPKTPARGVKSDRKGMAGQWKIYSVDLFSEAFRHTLKEVKSDPQRIVYAESLE
jgi:hypothetical protein